MSSLSQESSSRSNAPASRTKMDGQLECKNPVLALKNEEFQTKIAFCKHQFYLNNLKYSTHIFPNQ